MAARQLLVFQPGALVAEHQRHLLAASGCGQHLLGRLARRKFRQVHAAPARRQAQRQAAAGQAIDQFAVDAGTGQHVIRASRQRIRLRIGKAMTA